MNSKILAGGALLAFFLFSGKKSTSKSSSNVNTGEDPVENGDNIDETPVDTTPKNEVPTYKTLTPSRKKTIDSFINMSPMITNEPAQFGNYSIWASAKQKDGIPPLYQNWLANQAYWTITKAEGTTDLYSDIMGVNPPEYKGTYPYILQSGKKALIDPQTSGVQVVDITESKDMASKRLNKGIALWKDINKYILANYKGCNQGAYCG